ncbi:MAG: glycosyltransferase family 4 protein [Acidobacteriota bacterium]
MRIAFDATTLRRPQTGIGYYTEHLLHHLLTESHGDEILLISNGTIETSTTLAEAARIQRGHPFPVRNLWLQTLAPLVLLQSGAEVAHFTNSIAPLLKSVPTVVTIHDMSLRLFPHFHPRRRVLTRPLVTLTARRADAVIAVSHSAKRDIVDLTGVPAEKVHVIYEAAAPVFEPILEGQVLEEVRLRYGLGNRLLLHVGTIEPRKNLVSLVAAFAQLKKEKVPHQLVCAGALGWGYREVKRQIRRLEIGKHVRLLGYVPVADLPALYNLAEAFIFPSFHEGFGLPVLEAMACGTPVITAGHSSLAEIAGDAVELIDPHRIESILQALERLIDNQNRQGELAQRGLERSRRFTWHRAARETLQVYRRVAGC